MPGTRWSSKRLSDGKKTSAAGGDALPPGGQPDAGIDDGAGVPSRGLASGKILPWDTA